MHYSAICYSSTACGKSLLFVAACCTVCYLLPHAVQLAICFLMPYSLLFVVPHDVQFAFCCYMLYSLLFVAACHTVCRTIGYLLPREFTDYYLYLYCLYAYNSTCAYGIATYVNISSIASYRTYVYSVNVVIGTYVHSYTLCIPSNWPAMN